jgi:hypothetical protein
MRKTLLILLLLGLLAPRAWAQGEGGIFLVHLKTGLKHDDAQICVAYNVMWAAAREGYRVVALVDADAINTFKLGWRGRDALQGSKLPERLRRALAKEFQIPLAQVPSTYGQFIHMLRDMGVEFYINTGFLIVSGLGSPEEPLKKVSEKFFRPVSLREMVRLRAQAEVYMAY